MTRRYTIGPGLLILAALLPVLVGCSEDRVPEPASSADPATTAPEVRPGQPASPGESDAPTREPSVPATAEGASSRGGEGNGSGGFMPGSRGQQPAEVTATEVPASGPPLPARAPVPRPSQSEAPGPRESVDPDAPSPETPRPGNRPDEPGTASAAQPAGGPPVAGSDDSAAGADWPWWRGPNRNGVAEAAESVPVRWSETENVRWRTPVPGRGHSSPTVVGDRIYLATAEERRQIQSVVAFDRETGERVWKRDVNRGGFPKSHRKNTHATCTVACDGERLFVCFSHHGRVEVTALDTDGKPIWQESGPFQPKRYKYGYAPSPALYKSTVIVAADFDGGGGGYIVGLDRRTGQLEWRIRRPAKPSYSSPIVAHVAGRDQLLISGCGMVAAYDPATGRGLWSADATTMATCGTVVWEDDLVFASGGYPDAETACVRADGSGRVVWRNRQKCYEQSMLAHEGYLYAVNDNGIAYCWKGNDGTQMWRARLRGPVSASPVLAAGRIYLSNERGTTFVFEENPERFELVAQNELGNEAFATPSICGEEIFLRVAEGGDRRRQEYLYCIAPE